LVDGSPQSTQSVTRRRHSSIVQQPSVSAAKTATRRKATSLDETGVLLPCKQPQVEISPLKLTPPATEAATVVCEFQSELLCFHGHLNPDWF